MKPAEFEEREYEAPLYNQLAAGNSLVWSPGQVFEGYIGLDYAMLLEEPWLFQLHGFRSFLSGAVLARYRWPPRWFRPGRRGRLPTFRLNLFIQAKRPEWGVRPRAVLRGHGIGTPYWRFLLNHEQQKALESIATKLKGRALVVYAAPVFHQHKELFRLTRTGTIASRSTFPSAMTLQNHEAWIYSQAGATGVANPEITPFREPSLEDRIREIVGQGLKEAEPDWRASLKLLARGIYEALQSDTLEDTSRRAAFFDLVRLSQREFEDRREGEALNAYFTILAFCEIYMVEWLVVG